MSYKVCRALHRMGHCNKMFVKFKCCKTCEDRKWRRNRPKGDLERWRQYTNLVFISTAITKRLKDDVGNLDWILTRFM